MENAMTITLHEGVLNDDVIHVADEGYHFGNSSRFKFCVEYFTFANEWCNRKHHFYATSVESAIKRYAKETKRLNKEEAEEIVYDVYACVC